MPWDRAVTAAHEERAEDLTLTDTLFLAIFHNLPGISTGEEIDYYTACDRERLQRDLVSRTEHFLALFSESYDYEDYFSCADYAITGDSVDESELDTFRSVLDPDGREGPLTNLHPRDIFNGYRAVIGERLRSDDVAVRQTGIELFNFVMECALPGDDNRNPTCYIQVQTAKEFAPAFLASLLDTIRAQEETRLVVPRRRHLAQVLQPIQGLLAMMETVVSEEEWPQTDLALGKFLLLVDYYKRVIGT